MHAVFISGLEMHPEEFIQNWGEGGEGGWVESLKTNILCLNCPQLTDFLQPESMWTELGGRGLGGHPRPPAPTSSSLPRCPCSAVLTTHFIAATAAPGTAPLPRHARPPGPVTTPPIRSPASRDPPGDGEQLRAAGARCPGQPGPPDGEGREESP